MLGVALGVGLVTWVRPGALSLAVDIGHAVGYAAAAALVVDLAATAPDRPRPLDRGGLVRSLPWLVSLVVAVGGALAALPSVDLGGRAWFGPATWSAAPGIWLLISAFVMVALRWARRRMGSAPDALASGSWALLAGVLAGLALTTSQLMSLAGRASDAEPWAPGLQALAVLAIVAGHVAMIDPARRLSAGPGTRRVVAAALTLPAIGWAVASARAYIPADPTTLAIAVVATLLAAAGAYEAVSRIVVARLAPFGGRLLTAIEEAIEASAPADHLEALSRAVLLPLRRASLDLAGDARLYMVDPGREVRLDAAGMPHVRVASMPEAIMRRCIDRPGEMIVRGTLERLTIRRPELRPLVDVLVDLDALVVVPLVVRSEVEGALVIPRGRRRGAMTLEELHALERLADRLAGAVSMIASKERADCRGAMTEQAQTELRERLETLEDDLTRARADAHLLKAGPSADRMLEPPITYGPRMKAITRRIEEVGPVDAPVLLIAEAGTEVDRIAQRIHAASGRAAGPLLVADCASVRRDRLWPCLFGEEGPEPRPGWLRLAQGGAVLLVDVPALPIEVQHELAEVISTKHVQPLGQAGSIPVDVRVIATSRLPLEPLVDVGAFDPELERWLSPLRLDVPPLRERPEDLPSLVLLEIDRASRVLGRETIGVDAAALEELARHDWPGNLPELEWVIDRAVSAASAPRILPTDLPRLVRGDDSRGPDPLDGTFAEVERVILVRALERCDGNKTEAARLLGLKRSTFHDKLRRAGIAEPASESAAN
jgi:two-component system response regulator HydG